MNVSGLGDVFVRDTGAATAQKGTVLLLHGWMFPGETNWRHCYRPLAEAGYRAVSIDHRGHGRGLRPSKPFRLIDCASDAAALVRHLGCGPVVVAGYSMGGAIAQLMAAAHPELVTGLVLSGTATDWRQHARDRFVWRTMSILQFWLRLFPRHYWAWLAREVYPDDEDGVNWLISELSRNSPHDLAEAGRDLGRFDSRDWLPQVKVPIAVVCTRRDQLVWPSAQRRIVALVPGTTLFEINADHGAPLMRPDLFTDALLRAAEDVRGRSSLDAPASGAGYPISTRPEGRDSRAPRR